MGVCGVILGILGLIAALVATLCFGWIGGAVAILLGAIALALGLLKRKKSGNGGIGAVILGAIAIVVAAAIIPATHSTMMTLKTNLLKEIDKQESKYATVAKYVGDADTNVGFIGFITSMAGKVTEEDRAAFEEEIKDLSKLLSEKSASDSQAPAAEPAPAEAAEEPAG